MPGPPASNIRPDAHCPGFLPQGRRSTRVGSPMRPTPTPHVTTTDLDVCASCGRPFVVPSPILEVVPDNRHYVVELRCNNCDFTVVGTFDEDTMEALDRSLDRSQEELERAANRLYRENMLAEIE